MKKELELYLYKKYNNIFRDASGNSLLRGIECDDGWFVIINTLCDKIVNLVESHNANIDFEIEKTGSSSDVRMSFPSVVQVKEKFGSLRFYVDGGTETIYELIGLAENMSGYICEKCGNSGSLQGNGWLKTLCDSHAKELGYEVDVTTVKTSGRIALLVDGGYCEAEIIDGKNNIAQIKVSGRSKFSKLNGKKYSFQYKNLGVIKFYEAIS